MPLSMTSGLTGMRMILEGSGGTSDVPSVPTLSVRTVGMERVHMWQWPQRATLTLCLVFGEAIQIASSAATQEVLTWEFLPSILQSPMGPLNTPPLSPQRHTQSLFRSPRLRMQRAGILIRSVASMWYLSLLCACVCACVCSVFINRLYAKLFRM